MGALDLVGTAVGPVHAAPVPVEGEVPGLHEAADQGTDVATVEIGPLDAVGARVGPVEPGHGERGLVGGLHGDGEGSGCLQAPRVAGGHGNRRFADRQQSQGHQGIGYFHRGYFLLAGRGRVGQGVSVRVAAGKLEAHRVPGGRGAVRQRLQGRGLVVGGRNPGQGQAPRAQQALGHQVFDFRAVEIGSLDAVGAAVGPVELARGNVEGQAPGGAQTGGDEILDFRAVEVGPLNAVGSVVAPVELAAGRVQGESPGDLQAGGDEVFEFSAIKVCALDSVGAAVGPVELARGRVEG